MARIFDPATGECRIVDDLDFSEAEQTVHYRLDGMRYEIALSAENMARLRDCLKPYISVIHIVGRDVPPGLRLVSSYRITGVR